MTATDVRAAIDAGFAQGMFQQRAEVEAFLAWLDARGSLPPPVVVEIGAHRGGTAALWCALGAERVISVDLPDGPWGGIGVEAAARRDDALSRQYPAYIPVRGNSQDRATQRVVEACLHGYADLLFIDGDHSVGGVLHDLTHYGPLVKAGGVIALHDIADTERHRRDAVDVPEFWAGLKPAWDGPTQEFVCDGEWGGIGALVVTELAVRPRGLQP